MDEIRIAEPTHHHEIDGIPQEGIEVTLQLKMAPHPGAEVGAWIIFDEEVDVRPFGVKRRGHRGAKDIEPGHAIRATQFADGRDVLSEARN